MRGELARELGLEALVGEAGYSTIERKWGPSDL